MYEAVLFDVDGTLVDSNDAHARAWVEAFAEHGVTVDAAHVRRCVGMGGDKLMPAVSDVKEDSPLGQVIARRRGEIFRDRLLPDLPPFWDADELVAALEARG
jgi:beta-phosphoglucomutase-like phosphatase (HAD superfamily)